MLAGPQAPTSASGQDDPHPESTAGKQHSDVSRATPSAGDPNYLTFAEHRPRAPLLVPAALRREGSTVSNARSGCNSHSGSSRRSTPPAAHNQLNSNDEHLLTSSTSSAKLPTANSLPHSHTVTTTSKWLQSPSSSSPLHAAERTSMASSQTYLEEPVHYPNPANESLAIGQMLPTSKWTPDNQVQACQYSDCSAVFSPIQGKAPHSNTTFFGGFTNILVHPFHSRRHHCRACGKIFCSAHSSQTLPLSSHEATGAEAHLSPSPVTPGFASPITGAFPFSILRRDSSSGVATPSGSPEQHAQSSHSASPPVALEVVRVRVCDDCYTSSQLASSLAGLVSFSARSPPSLSHSAASADHFEFRSQTPTHLQPSSRSQTAVTATQEPHANNRERQREPSGSDFPEQDNSAVRSHRPERREVDPHQAAFTSKKAQSLHPLDLRHSRLDALASEEGVNASGSLAASLGTTPGIGWTWSTF